jgi:hypothetical protein
MNYAGAIWRKKRSDAAHHWWTLLHKSKSVRGLTGHSPAAIAARMATSYARGGLKLRAAGVKISTMPLDLLCISKHAGERASSDRTGFTALYCY